jgi:methyl-accepting chemotaxis protein
MDPSPRKAPAHATPDTVMSGQPRADGTPAASFFGRFLGRRRTYVVDRAYQVRTAVVSVLGMIFLLLFAAALFHLLTLENARVVARRAPFLARAASENDARSVLYLVAAGIIFVAAVFVIEILETHKTAGVVYKVTRALRELESGRWSARVALRRGDNFREMEEAFNAAARSLREAVDDDLRALQAMEGRLRLAGREFETGNHEGALVLLRQVAGELQHLKEQKRSRLEAPGSPPGTSKI